MREEIFMAGTGGQGVLSAGQMLGQVALEQGLSCSYLPLYSAEVRGGTATATVVISDGQVGSPVVGKVDSLLLFSKKAVDAHLNQCRQGGLVIVNSSFTGPVDLPDMRVLEIPATAAAAELGFEQVANMVMLGAYCEARGTLDIDYFEQALRAVLPERYHKHIPLNMDAVRKGTQLASQA